MLPLEKRRTDRSLPGVFSQLVFSELSHGMRWGFWTPNCQVLQGKDPAGRGTETTSVNPRQWKRQLGMMGEGGLVSTAVGSGR